LEELTASESLAVEPAASAPALPRADFMDRLRGLTPPTPADNWGTTQVGRRPGGAQGGLCPTGAVPAAAPTRLGSEHIVGGSGGGRDGRSVTGAPERTGPARRPEDDRLRRGRRAGGAHPLSAGGGGGRPLAAPQHRAGVRGRRAQRAAVPGLRAGRRRVAGPV